MHPIHVINTKRNVEVKVNGILYFSGTGNSLHIAKKVQERFSGGIKYIPKYQGNGKEFDVIFLVTPIYSYGMPKHVYDLLPKLNKKSKLYIIQNYGGMVGGADHLTYTYCKKYGLNIQGVWTIKMTENYTLSFTVPKFYLNKALKTCNVKIEKVLNEIESGKNSIPKKKRTKEEKYLKNMSNWHIIGSRFHTSDDCVKCGKCISLCPVGNIFLKDGKICFGDKCVACLGCYHRCPQKAIKYQNKKKSFRYINPFIDENEIGKDL